MDKMWKYISGVSKVVDEEKNNTPPKAASDTRKYEKTRLKYVDRERFDLRVVC